MDGLIGTKKVAAMLGVSAKTILNLCTQHEIEYYRIGNKFLFSNQQIEEYLERQKNK